MRQIWVINTESGGYAGRGDITEATERKLFRCERDWEKWYKFRKRYFENREDAEDYIRPIAELAFKALLSDWESNVDGDEDNEDDLYSIKEYRLRGFQEIRIDELEEDSPYYEFYHRDEASDEPITFFVCPAEYEDDRIGYYFASVKRVSVY